MKLCDKSKVGELMKHYGFSAPDMTITEFIEDELTTISAVPVVRCRECIHRNGTPGQPNILCGQMHGDDFCSYGQRKEANHEVSE